MALDNSDTQSQPQKGKIGEESWISRLAPYLLMFMALMLLTLFALTVTGIIMTNVAMPVTIVGSLLFGLAGAWLLKESEYLSKGWFVGVTCLCLAGAFGGGFTLMYMGVGLATAAYGGIIGLLVASIPGFIIIANKSTDRELPKPEGGGAQHNGMPVTPSTGSNIVPGANLSSTATILAHSSRDEREPDNKTQQSLVSSTATSVDPIMEDVNQSQLENSETEKKSIISSENQEHQESQTVIPTPLSTNPVLS